MHFQQIISFLIFISSSIAFGQDTIGLLPNETVKDHCSKVEIFDDKLALLYQDLYNQNITKDSLISHNKDEIKERLILLNEKTPFVFSCSEINLLFIQKYISKREKFAQKMFDYSLLYFPFFENQLIENELPLELKYLPIVESALNPTAESRAGAVGLWQFMPLTAKMMGLEINSYIDQRRDPILSTKAACLYLKKLFKIYEDWNLALAAYNAGPGNVNKAIRRSGGKKTYWEIRPFLPKETQNYVPAFTAVNYLMEFYSKNEPSFSGFKYHQIDTIEVNQRIEFKVMENWLSYDEAKIAELNPVYKLKIIPKDNSNNTLYLPNFLIGDFLMLQDSIYHYSKKSIHSPSNSNSSSQTSYYTIKEGDTIWEIAEKHPGVSVADIKKLNSTINISNVKKGDRILIYMH